jgi:hypothetical protein
MKIAVLGLAPLFAATAGFSADLEVLPPTSVLSSPESRQRLIVQATVDGFNEDWSERARWESSNPDVARVDQSGIVTPVGDGEAIISATVEGRKASAKVVVKDARARFQWSFRNDVIPVLTKAGCNQGACHGALAGKNGFKLTLRGYDPFLDYDALTRHSVGRRVSLADPASSLLLRKPTFALPHGGGKRFAASSIEYRIIAEWIAEGAPGPQPDDPFVSALEVFPVQVVLKPGAGQQLVVRAKYSDGRVRDVTHWTKFSSNNEGVATVDDEGRVRVNGRGEAAITLWFSNQVLYARIISPYDHKPGPDAYLSFRPKNFIDELTLAKWKSLNLIPSAPSSDSQFLRRAYLDAVGILPTPEEVEEFLASKAADKRAKLIDSLLEREEYADYWAYKWSDLLLVSSRKLRPNAMWAFYNWIRDSVKNNKPWDQFARDIFTGAGSTRENGALNYYVLHKDTVELAENVTQAFLSQRLTCARCHNHPMEKWTQTQYYQFANLFSRVGIKNGDLPGENIIYAKADGDIKHPRLLRPLAPTPLDGKPIPLDSAIDRRLHFAEWLTSPDNQHFARAIVNRVWGNFMGRGLVDPIDDVRATNPASNEELFRALTRDFVENGYDIKRLIRLIMNSATYQLSSEANATNQADTVYYSKYIVKRLAAEVLLDAISQVTGVPSSFPGYPPGTRAMQLPDVRIQSQFLSAFGRPERIICDAAERSSDPSISQALHVINGDTLNKKLSDPNGYVALLQKLGLSDSRIIEHIFLSAFSRYPTEHEMATIKSELAQARNSNHASTPEAAHEARRHALEDMLWALLTSKEFLFNH